MKPYNRDKTTKSEEVREMFDKIAPAYDRLNHILSLQIDKLWRRKVVKMAKKLAPGRVIDLATGTGDLAIAISKALPEAKIVAIDPSEGMLKVAQEKIKAEGLEERITIEVGSAEALPTQDGQADLITVAFGVRNFGNLQRGLDEIARSTREGGAVIILEFSTPPNPIFRWFYNLYSRNIMPFIGGLLSRDRRAYEYLPASVEEFPAPDRVAEMLVKAGFVQPHLRSLTFGVAHIYCAVKQSAE
ncbi:MAG: bifunctional demethylmenaquinone methyltransferase/2-methoxy-6-polyprenyl-1,4-benzoquinol methylase UbiE [Rikenellaceae bacterium]